MGEQGETPGGRPGLTVARIALGCGNFGGIGSAPEFFGQGLTQDQAFELMDAAWESGIGWFDTADAYGGGRSERAIGLALGWLLAGDRVAQVVVGPGRPEHLAPIAEALRHPVTAAERIEIEEAVAGPSGEVEP